MVAKVSALFERLTADGIGYCHWKSNWMLDETMSGATDLDLLVERTNAAPFRKLLQDLGFRPAIELGFAPYPSVEHYHALDETSGRLVHVHAYYRVISGDSLTKNYRLPLEAMLLGNVRRVGMVNVPSKGSELVVFVLRMHLKHTTMAELTLLLRDWQKVRHEAAWLATQEARAEATMLLRAWLPSFDACLFEAALDALSAPAALWRRLLIARRVRAELRPFARYGRARASIVGLRKFAEKGTARMRRSRKGLAPASGGAVIAFVGAEASGKSTMLHAVDRWLGSHYTVQRIHAGKPPSTLLTVLPNLVLPALRALVPDQRSTVVSGRLNTQETSTGPAPFPLLFGIRSVLLAHDRRALLTRAFGSSANGAIVLCDRYPSVESGAVDGAQLGAGPRFRRDRVRRWLADLEARFYRDIPPPDLVIQLTTPLQVTLERNRTRAKSEPDEYVLSRHARSSRLRFERVPVENVDTDRPLQESTREIRQVIWDAL
ncbi:MAG: hypothetical protein H0U00_02765 [Actinobacteria bacterium]|nr:hypothetical protein [Actinomycetota bacterium]